MAIIKSIQLKSNRMLTLESFDDRLIIKAGNKLLKDEDSKEFTVNEAKKLFDTHVEGFKLLNLIKEKQKVSVDKSLGYVSLKVLPTSSTNMFDKLKSTGVDNLYNPMSYHFTLMYDNGYKPLEAHEDKETVLSAKPSHFEILAKDTEKAALTLVFESDDMQNRHTELKEKYGMQQTGIENPEIFIPHITVKYLSRCLEKSLEEKMKELNADLEVLNNSNVIKEMQEVFASNECWRPTKNTK